MVRLWNLPPRKACEDTAKGQQWPQTLGVLTWIPYLFHIPIRTSHLWHHLDILRSHLCGVEHKITR